MTTESDAERGGVGSEMAKKGAEENGGANDYKD